MKSFLNRSIVFAVALALASTVWAGTIGAGIKTGADNAPQSSPQSSMNLVT